MIETAATSSFTTASSMTFQGVHSLLLIKLTSANHYPQYCTRIAQFHITIETNGSNMDAINDLRKNQPPLHSYFANVVRRQKSNRQTEEFNCSPKIKRL